LQITISTTSIFFLYELDGVNLGQFIPTKTKLAVDANQTLTYLSDSNLDLEDTVIVGESIPDLLTLASLQLFAVGRDTPSGHWRGKCSKKGHRRSARRGSPR
jgi:hypothetical protein